MASWANQFFYNSGTYFLPAGFAQLAGRKLGWVDIALERALPEQTTATERTERSSSAARQWLLQRQIETSKKEVLRSRKRTIEVSLQWGGIIPFGS